MKKIILITLMLVQLQSIAQIRTNAGTFSKPTKGAILTEVTFAPNIGGSGMFSLPEVTSNAEIFGVKGRYFKFDNYAYRFAGNITVDAEGDNVDFIVGLSAGIEKHLIGAERLSTYWGYEGNLGIKSKQTSETDFFGVSSLNTDNVIGVGANIFTGFDYYTMPNVYLGLEIAYGLAITNKQRNSNPSVTSIELSPGVSSFLRLGWRL